MLLPDPPLRPSPSEARSWAARELVRPEYHDQDPLETARAWLARTLDHGLARAGEAPPLSALAAMLVLLLLVGALAWLASRARRTARATPAGGEVITEEEVSADQLRRRAREALEEERYAAALVEAYRALARAQVERGVLPDDPGSTAHEVATRLGAEQPGRGPELARAAGWFDAVLYGERPATPEQVRAVLSLDADLAGVR